MSMKLILVIWPPTDIHQIQITSGLTFYVGWGEIVDPTVRGGPPYSPGPHYLKNFHL